MIMSRSLILTLACLLLASAGNAQAGTVFLTNANSLTATPGPFAGSTFGIGNFATLTQSGATLTVEAIGGDSTITVGGNSEPIGINGTGAPGFFGDGDAVQFGIGVRGSGSFAINGNTAEALSLSFDQNVTINSIDLNGIGFGTAANDRALVTIGGSTIDVFGSNIVNITGTPLTGVTFNGGTTNGDINDVINFATPLALTAGDTIRLEGPNAGTGTFTLRGLDVNIPEVVPEPSSMMLLAFTGIAACLRRRR